MSVQKEQEEFAFYYQLLKGNYKKGGLTLQDILGERKSAESFTGNTGALMTVFTEFTKDANNRILYDVMEKSGYMESAMNNYFRILGLDVKNTFGATVNDSAAVNGILANYTARNAMFNSPHCMAAAADSAAAMNVMAAESLDDLPLYPAAMDAVFASPLRTVRTAYMQPEYAAEIYGTVSKDYAPWNVTPKPGGDAFVGTGKVTPLANPSMIAAVGEKIFFYGNSNARSIYSAPLTDPLTLTYTGKSMPYDANVDSRFFIANGNIYICCSYNNLGLYSAPLSAPDSVTLASSNSLKYNASFASLAAVGGYVYLYGGQTYGQRVQRTPLSNPTAWEELTNVTLPFAAYQSPLVIAGSYIYIYANYPSGNSIMRAHISDPASFTLLNRKLPYACPGATAAVIGDYVYLYGGYSTASTKIMRAPLSDPSDFAEVTGAALPVGYLYSGRMVIADGAAYLYGGDSGANVISRCQLN